MERQFRSTDAKTRRSDHQQDDKGKDEGQGEGDRGEGNDGGRRGLVEDEVLDNIKCCVWSSTSDSSNASAPTSSSGVSLGNHLSSASESVAAAADAMLMQPWWGFPHFGCWLFSMDEEEGPCGVRSWWSVLFGCHGRHGNQTERKIMDTAIRIIFFWRAKSIGPKGIPTIAQDVLRGTVRAG